MPRVSFAAEAGWADMAASSSAAARARAKTASRIGPPACRTADEAFLTISPWLGGGGGYATTRELGPNERDARRLLAEDLRAFTPPLRAARRLPEDESLAGPDRELVDPLVVAARPGLQ